MTKGEVIQFFKTYVQRNEILVRIYKNNFNKFYFLSDQTVKIFPDDQSRISQKCETAYLIPFIIPIFERYFKNTISVRRQVSL